MPERPYFDTFVARLGDSEVQAAMRQGFPVLDQFLVKDWQESGNSQQ